MKLNDLVKDLEGGQYIQATYDENQDPVIFYKDKEGNLRFVDEVNVGDIEVVVIPPIESVNYGRDVGYAINELVPPQDIKEISATKIRNGK